MAIQALLVSGGGLLGSVLARELPRLGVGCVVTARQGALPFDLEKPVAPQLGATLARGRFTHGILSAAMADVDECFRQPERSRRVNVEGPRELLTLFREHGITPVFFSTDLVFDGLSDLRREGDPLAPTTLYARQKVETESQVRELCPAHLIFRTSKLMSVAPHPRNILTPIVSAGRGQGAYRAFRDQFITPVFAEDVARALAGAFRAGLTGSYHLAGTERFSRLELALAVCRELGLDPSRIEESELAAVRFSEPRGPFNTLNSEKLRAALGFRFTPLAEGVRALTAGENPRMVGP